MSQIQDIPWGLVAPIIAIHLILVVIACIDLARIERTNGPRWMWVPIILCISILGSVAYFVIGRRQD